MRLPNQSYVLRYALYAKKTERKESKLQRMRLPQFAFNKFCSDRIRKDGGVNV